MTDFQSFRNAVLEDDDLQDEVMSIVNATTANGSGLGDGIATLGMKHNYFFTSEEVYAHTDLLGEGGDRRLHIGSSSSQVERLSSEDWLPALA